MSVAELMSDSLVMVAPDDRLDVAETLMLLAESRHVPVVDQGTLVGVISLRDLLAAELPSTRSTEGERWEHMKTIQARAVMSRPPVVIGPHEPLVRAAELMLLHRISSLPVMEGEDLVGILTSSDLIEHAIELARRETERTGAAPTVARLMTPAPLMTVQANNHLDVAQLLMQYERCRHLPVLEGQRLVGILSDRDILGALRSSLEALPPAEKRAHDSAIEVSEIMTPAPETTTPTALAAEAGELLLDRSIGALPVVDGDRLVGILTERDFLSFVVQSQAAARPGALPRA